MGGGGGGVVGLTNESICIQKRILVDS